MRTCASQRKSMPVPGNLCFARKGSHGRLGVKRISPSCCSHVPWHSNVPSGIAQRRILSSRPLASMTRSCKILTILLAQ